MDLGIGGLGDAEVVENGRTAVVYRASRLDDSLEVAVRVLTISDPDIVHRFDQRIAALRSLSTDDGIVTIHETGLTADGRPFLVVDYCSTTLADQLAENGKMAEAQACKIVATITSAIDTAHGHGVVHGDLRPENVFVSAAGEYLVGNFGLEEVLGADFGFPSVNVGYTPPEFLDHGRLSPPSDVYGLGVLLFTLVTGAPPYGDLGLDQNDLTQPMEEYLLRRLSDAGVASGVADFVVRSMSRYPNQRPSTAELLELLEQHSRVGERASVPLAGRELEAYLDQEVTPLDESVRVDPSPTLRIPVVDVANPAEPTPEELASFAPPSADVGSWQPDDRAERFMFDRPNHDGGGVGGPVEADSPVGPPPVLEEGLVSGSVPEPGRDPDDDRATAVDAETAILLQSLKFEPPPPPATPEPEAAERLPEVDLLLSRSHQVLPEVVTGHRYHPENQDSLATRLEVPMRSISRLLGGLLLLAAPILVGLLIYLSQRDATPIETVDLGEGGESAAVPTIVIPPTVGLGKAVAVTRLENASLEPRLTYAFTNQVPVGIVIATTPGTGDAVELGTEIDVSVSLGTEPSCAGLTEPAVRRLLDERRIEASIVNRFDEEVNAGTVIDCTFDLSTAAATVVVSDGPDTGDEE